MSSPVATSQEIKNSIRSFIIDQKLFGQGTIDDDASFLDNGIIDSTGVLELVDYIETTYRIKVENDELTPDNLDSVDNIAAFLGRKLILASGSPSQ